MNSMSHCYHWKWHIAKA